MKDVPAWKLFHALTHTHIVAADDANWLVSKLFLCCILEQLVHPVLNGTGAATVPNTLRQLLKGDKEIPEEV